MPLAALLFRLSSRGAVAVSSVHFTCLILAFQPITFNTSTLYFIIQGRGACRTAQTPAQPAALCRGLVLVSRDLVTEIWLLLRLKYGTGYLGA